ncbi:MAG TPA: hypothetical protein VFT50_03580 [Baekduia sp.]|nr:hypothetical protein [Baekduia sp.]
MTRSPRRRLLAVLSMALVVCLAGMALSVVAFGQAGGNPDANVPLGDFTGTTPARDAQATTTTPTSGYTTTSPTSGYTTTSPTSGYTTTTPATTTPTTPSGQGSKPAPHHKPKPTPTPSTPAPTPVTPRTTKNAHVSQVTRPGPNQLAFTGGEPLLIGAAGAGLMLAATALQLRRRRGGSAA